VIRAIIFDCFGVLISDALHVMCAELNARDSEAASEVWKLINLANRGLITSAASTVQIAELFGVTPEEYRMKVAQGEVKDEALLTYIAELRSSYKTAVLTNIPAGSLSRRFSGDDLKRYFDAVVASGEIGYTKPAAQAYSITAEKLAVSPYDCVFVDDRESNLDGARVAGMQAILYTDFTQFKRDLEALFANA
jgi:HAD superfamily hydrolase (TIGR01509 family)